jgi:hypothetical protein
MTVTSVNQFDSQAAFEAHVLSSLRRVTTYHDFLFTDVPESWGEAVFRLIDEKIPSRKTHDTKNRTVRIKVMSTGIHNCITPWLVKEMSSWLQNHTITQAEESLLNVGMGTTLELRRGPYRGSKKEPDFFFQVDDHIMPTVVVESGWSESDTRLYNDMNLLLVGNGSLRVVIIVKWRKLQGNRVSGTVELFLRDRNGIPRLEQSETVFPDPTTGNNQRLGIRRRDIFGPALLAGRSGSDVLYLDINQLRGHATKALHFMNLVPA